MMEWLVKLRGNVSQQVFSQRLGISQSMYAAIEVGNRKPSVKTAKKIADVIGCDWTKFYEDSQEKAV